MHDVLNYAMGYIEDLVDQAAHHQRLGNEIEKQLCLMEARDLAESIDNEEDLLTMKLLSEI